MKELERNPCIPEGDPFTSVRKDMRRLKFALKDVFDRRSRGELSESEFWQAGNQTAGDFIASLREEIPHDTHLYLDISDKHDHPSPRVQNRPWREIHMRIEHYLINKRGGRQKR